MYLGRFPYFDLVEYPGIEPGVPEDGGFTVHCITIDASTPYYLVRVPGLEPGSLAAADFKSAEFTNFSILAFNLAYLQGLEPRRTVLETVMLPLH